MTDWHEYPKECPPRNGQNRSADFMITTNMGMVVMDTYDFLYDTWVGNYKLNVIAWAIKPEPYARD